MRKLLVLAPLLLVFACQDTQLPETVVTCQLDQEPEIACPIDANGDGAVFYPNLEPGDHKVVVRAFVLYVNPETGRVEKSETGSDVWEWTVEP